MFRLELLEIQLVKSVAGRKIRTIIEEQSEEIMMLINKRRAVTSTWHRNKGPEFVAAIFKSGINEDVNIPKDIDGIKLNTLLRRMAAILQENGSPFLKKSIGEHSVMIMNWAQNYNSLKEVFKALKGMDEKLNLESN